MISPENYGRLLRVVEDIVKEARNKNPYINCVSCLNFNQHDEVCEIAKARPPAIVIVTGCEQWLDDIPF